jgi:multidrug efflux pump subunit AcrB
VANATGYIGPGGPTVTENNGRLFIQLKPHSQRDISADEVIRHLDAKLQSIQGIRAYLQAAQDINIGARLLKTQYQYTLTDVDQDELNAWASKLFKAVQTLPELSDVATDQAITGRQLNLEIDRDTRRGWESIQERSTIRFTTLLVSGTSLRSSRRSITTTL